MVNKAAAQNGVSVWIQVSSESDCLPWQVQRPSVSASAPCITGARGFLSVDVCLIWLVMNHVSSHVEKSSPFSDCLWWLTVRVLS